MRKNELMEILLLHAYLPLMEKCDHIQNIIIRTNISHESQINTIVADDFGSLHH